MAEAMRRSGVTGTRSGVPRDAEAEVAIHAALSRDTVRVPGRGAVAHYTAGRVGHTIHESEDEVRLVIDGVLDSGHLRLPTARQTDEFLALAAGKSGGAVIDFQRHRCMSDRTSAWLVWLCGASRGRATTLRMANLCAEDRKLLELFKVDRVIRIDDDDDEPPLGVVAR